MKNYHGITERLQRTPHGGCVCGTQYGEMGLSGTTHPSSPCHFSKHAVLCAAFFPFPGMRVFSCYRTMSALPVEPVATAVAEPHVGSVLAVTYAAPVPVIDCVTPVQVVNTLLPLCGFAAPAPVLENVAVAPVKKYVAPAPAVTCGTAAQQFLAACTMAAVMTGVNLDVTGLGNSTVFHHGC